jgi:hypothetical protein
MISINKLHLVRVVLVPLPLSTKVLTNARRFRKSELRHPVWTVYVRLGFASHASTSVRTIIFDTPVQDSVGTDRAQVSQR